MKTNKYIVAIVTAICLLSLAYISSLRNLKFDFITSNAPFYVFFIYLLNSKKIANKKKNILFWSGGIISVTIAVSLIQLS